MEYFLIAFGLALLIKGGDFLLDSSVEIALKFKIPAMIVGLTVVSFATSAPELMVSVISSVNGKSEIALGNVIGSNIANLGLILGITLVFTSIELSKKFLKNDYLFLISSVLLYFLLAKFDLNLSRLDGIILLIFLVVFIWFQIKGVKQNDTSELTNQDVNKRKSNLKIVGIFLIGILMMFFGSDLLVENASLIAQKFGVSERIIAVSIIAVGTSLPELTASLIAIYKKQFAMSLGNVVGSNIINILVVLGVSSVISPIKVDNINFITTDFYVMLLMSLLVLVFYILPKRSFLDYKFGITLLILYSLYMFINFYNI